MERVLFSFSFINKNVTVEIYHLLLISVVLVYTLLWGGYVASWRSALYGLEKKYYPRFFQKFLNNQRMLLFFLCLPIVQIPWIFILLFALRHAMISHGKMRAASYNFLFFHMGVIVILLQFLGFGLSARAVSENEKWMVIFMQFFILALAMWQWRLVHKIQHQLRK